MVSFNLKFTNRLPVWCIQASATPPKLERFQPPGYSVERSRDQVLCRTGVKGAGQSVAYKFADYGGSSDKAISAAKKWVAAQAKKCVAG